MLSKCICGREYLGIISEVVSSDPFKLKEDRHRVDIGYLHGHSHRPGRFKFRFSDLTARILIKTT